jgi:oxalate---CoA ligase
MIPEYGLLTIRDLLFNGNQDPDHHAIECPGYRPLTYRDLRQQILSVVRTLNSLGFHRNDRIAVIIPAGPEAAVAIIAVMAGFTVIALNPQSREGEFTAVFSRLGIKAIIVQKDQQTPAPAAARSQNIPVIELVPLSDRAGIFDLQPAGSPAAGTPDFATSSDIAYIIMTSGTTASAKIVLVSQKQSALSKQRACRASGITAADRALHIIPYYHGMGVGAPLLTPLIAGGTVICTREFIPPDFPDLLRTYRPTYYTAGPALHAGILRELRKRPPGEVQNNSLRYIRTSSGFLPEHIRQELESVLRAPVIDAYGMSEAGSIATNIPPKKGSVGIPYIESVQVIDPDGQPLGVNIPGEIVIRGETVFSGYENAPEESKAAFIDGWFRTGDLGYLDDDGYLFLTGRKTELINKGGEKISPEEVDTVLRSHPGVKEAMSFRIEDPVLGEDIAAMVVPADALVSEAELRRYLLDRLIPFKVPRRIYVVQEIPKTAIGKPMRHAGTEQYSGHR